MTPKTKAARNKKIEWVKDGNILRSKGYKFIIWHSLKESGKFTLECRQIKGKRGYFLEPYGSISSAKRAAERHINKLFNDMKNGKI